MLVGEVVERLSKGENLKEIAASINVSVDVIQRRIRRIGYTWDKSKKCWFWPSAEPEPLDDVLYSPDTEFKVNKNNPDSEVRVNKISSKSEEKVNSVFSDNEVKMLKAVAAEREQVGSVADLYIRIFSLPSGKKTRKTVILDEEIGKRLDKFADRFRLDKQDIYSLALRDFMDKYEQD